MNKHFIFAVFLSLGLSAQSPLSLNEAVKLALEQNLNIQLAGKSAEIADKQENWGQAGFLPNVAANASYSYSQTDVQQQLAVGSDTSGGAPPIRTFNDAVAENYNAGLSASYVLFDGLGRINNWKKLQLQKEQSELQLRFTIENTLLQVFSAYYDVSRQADRLDIAQESIALSLRRYQRAQTAQELGSQSKLEALTALVDLGRDSVNYWNAQNALIKSRRALNQLLNLPLDTLYALEADLKLRSDLEYGVLYTEALSNNAALIQAEISRSINQKNLNIARSERLPEIAANAGYNFSRQENEGGFLLFTENTGWQYGLNAQWNLFSSYRSQTAIEVARIAIFQSDLSLEQARQQVQVDLSNAWLDHQNAKEILAVEKRILKVALMSFERSKEAYALGSITNVQLREAQINYISAKAAVNDLSYQLKLTEIELQRVAGVLLGKVDPES
ncbi:MAG: TolC family protein [Bacteroidetes bacterium]|nr:TolC family protein [Bacteroidota bacterium]